MRTRLRCATVLAAASLLLVAAACGDDEGADDPSATEAPSGATDAPPDATEAPTDVTEGTAAPTDATGGTEAPTDATEGTEAPTDATEGTEAPTDATEGTEAPTDTTRGTGAGGDVAAAAQERVEPYLQPATSIGIEEPVEGEIPSDVSVYWLEGNIQSILPITGGFEEATEALGWDLTTLTYDPADPQGPGAAMQQAVDAGADYIAVSGQTTDILGAGLEAAMSAGIPVIDMYSTDEVGGESNGIYANVGGPASSEASYPVLSDLIIADSGGEANVLLVSIPDFAILNVATDGIKEHFSSECPDCSVESLDVTIADLTSGSVASQIVSAVQSNPDIGYVLVVIGDLATGLPEALASAGMEDVKIVGNVPNAEQIQSLVDGTSFAWLPLPRAESAWAAVDSMVRLAAGQEVSPNHEVLPIEIWTPENVPTPVEEYEGPEGYQDQFMELWGIGG